MRSLSINETLTGVPVLADNIWNSTGITVHSGEKYHISASADEWFDAGIKSTAAGQPGVGIQKCFNFLRRCRDALWFELVGCVNRSKKQMFLIGLDRIITIPNGKGGELYFFANDVIFMYWNNYGEVRVTITRLY